MELAQQIAMLENALQQHIKEWERFFAGIIKVPPETDRERLARRLRHLTEVTVHRRADQFRLEQLQHRFMTYSQNWKRMLRDREEGRGPKSLKGAASGQTAPLSSNETAAASVEKKTDDPLFDRYIKAKQELGLDIRVDRKEFEEQIAQQRRKIEERLGRKVNLEVQVEDGRVRVVARKTKKRESTDAT